MFKYLTFMVVVCMRETLDFPFFPKVFQYHLVEVMPVLLPLSSDMPGACYLEHITKTETTNSQ